MAQWLHEHSIPFHSFTCVAVVRTGCLEMLQWLHDHGCPWDRETTFYAKEEGNTELFDCTRSHGCAYDEDYISEESLDTDSEAEQDSDDDDMTMILMRLQMRENHMQIILKEKPSRQRSIRYLWWCTVPMTIDSAHIC